MLNKCACGRYTNYGVSCAMCVINTGPSKDELDFNLDEIVGDLDLATPDEEEIA